jgi:hypothetical protein
MSHDPDRDLDDLLGDDAGRFGAVYRRLPRYEPPRRLDRAVLGEAARAVHSGKPPRRQRWIVGVGSAAGLVLAAGIAWRIGHDAMNPNEAAAPTIVPVQPISEPARAKREEQAQPQAEQADAAPALESRAQNATASPPPRDEIKQTPHKSRASSKPAAAEPRTPPPAPAAAPPPAPFPAQERDRAAAKDLEKSDTFGATSATGAAAAGAVAPAEDKKAKLSSEGESGLASPTTPSGSVELRRDMQLAPDEWLSHIRQLKRQGRHQQAMESLRLFARMHPDWTIPDDLRPLLD